LEETRSHLDSYVNSTNFNLAKRRTAIFAVFVYNERDMTPKTDKKSVTSDVCKFCTNWELL